MITGTLAENKTKVSNTTLKVLFLWSMKEARENLNIQIITGEK